MKIALVQDFLRMGGTERQTVALANAFSAAGHDVMVLAFRPGGPLASQLGGNIQRAALQPVDLKLDWFAPGLLRVLKSFAPDVTQLMGKMAHTHGWRIVRAIPSTRVIATFRTGKPISLFYRHTIRRAAAVVANSSEAAHRLARLNRIDPRRVRIIRNAVTAPQPPAPDSRATVRTEIGAAPGAVVFVCVAMLRPEKQHRVLLEGTAKLPRDFPWELWIAGEGEERPALEAFARAENLSSRVRFLGLRNDANRLYAAADVAVLASARESLPNFLVEAQWAGLPVVACDAGGVSETFSPNTSGTLVPVGDASALATAMQTLAANPSLRASMSAAARHYARTEFDPARQHARYLELFQATE